MNFPLGYNSDGKEVNKSILTDSHLFISYNSPQQIRDFFYQLLLSNADDYPQCLEICREQNKNKFPLHVAVSSYFYDEPSNGNILSKAYLFAAAHKLLIKRKNRKKLTRNPTLVLIDDILQVLPGLNKYNSKWLKNLLTDGAAYQIYFVIGSTLPYRNLLLQLMQKCNKRNSPVNEIGAEIIINPEQLLFFREQNQLPFEIHYPAPPDKTI